MNVVFFTAFYEMGYSSQRSNERVFFSRGLPKWFFFFTVFIEMGFFFTAFIEMGFFFTALFEMG